MAGAQLMAALLGVYLVQAVATCELVWRPRRRPANGRPSPGNWRRSRRVRRLLGGAS